MPRRWRKLLAAGAVAATLGCDAPPRADVFSPAHATAAAAIADFLGVRRTPEQPFPFPHSTHAAKRVGCTDYCHESVVDGPIAGLPSVKTCMACHNQIATDRPLIRQLAALEQAGIDLGWQRVYGYTPSAHVCFNHAPHVRAKVECTQCHGNVGEQITAERVVDLNMGFCVNCHREKQASLECLSCHY
jgi:hypothetical protein